MGGSRMIDKDFLKLLPYKSKMAKVDKEIVSGLKNAGYISELKRGYMVIPVRRYQKDIQAGQMSIRLAICYLPRDGRNDRYFKGVDKVHGGRCVFEYDLAVKAPLLVRSGCGGRGYEIAAKAMGLDTDYAEHLINTAICKYYELRLKLCDKEVLIRHIRKLLSVFVKSKHCDYDVLDDIIYTILAYGRKGNILLMALREIVYLDIIRRSGYDSVVCYNYTRDGRIFINEVADLRTIKYPSNHHCEYKEFSDIHSKFVSKADREECII